MKDFSSCHQRIGLSQAKFVTAVIGEGILVPTSCVYPQAWSDGHEICLDFRLESIWVAPTRSTHRGNCLRTIEPS
jgi:hypothetical protein